MTSFDVGQLLSGAKELVGPMPLVEVMRALPSCLVFVDAETSTSRSASKWLERLTTMSVGAEFVTVRRDRHHEARQLVIERLGTALFREVPLTQRQWLILLTAGSSQNGRAILRPAQRASARGLHEIHGLGTYISDGISMFTISEQGLARAAQGR